MLLHLQVQVVLVVELQEMFVLQEQVELVIPLQLVHHKEIMVEIVDLTQVFMLLVVAEVPEQQVLMDLLQPLEVELVEQE